MAAPKPFRRLYERIPCDLPVLIYSSSPQRKLGEGRFLNICLGGAAFLCSLELPMGSAYEFRLNWEMMKFHATGKIVWAAAPNNKRPKLRDYGVNFNLIAKQEEILKKIIDQLRRETPAKDYKLGKDYWSL